MFLISTLVAYVVPPAGRSEMLASTRSEPSSIFTSETPMAPSRARNSVT
jgi:hypothetical protein